MFCGGRGLVQTITDFVSSLLDMFSGNVRQLAKQIPEPKVTGVATKVYRLGL